MSTQIVPVQAISLSLNQSLRPGGYETLVGQTWSDTQLPVLKTVSLTIPRKTKGDVFRI